MSLTDIFNGATGDTLLANAVSNGNTEMVKKLLELGADINIPSPPVPAIPMPVPVMPVPQTMPSAPAAAAAPAKPKKPAIVKMATDRQVVAPPTARFRKKQPMRQTTL
jgi:hypothetical protein